MHTVKKYGLSALLISLSLSAVADEMQLQQAVDDTLNKHCLASKQTAVSIVRLPDGQAVYNKNASTPLLPASILKLATTAAALNYLGPEYRFKTKVYHTGAFDNGVIEGDVYLKGEGDPTLSSENLWYISNQLRQKGIEKINGQIYADVSFFDDYDRSPNWVVNHSQRPHDAKIGALSLNLNTIAVHIAPSEQVGEPAQAWLDPAPAHILLDIAAQTTGKGKKQSIWAQRLEDNGQTIIKVKGAVRVNDRERAVFLTVDNPTRYTIETFKSYLTKLGIDVLGDTATGVTPASAKLLHQYKSEPLSVILKELNTYSNNMIAEHLIKTIAATQTGERGSHEAGLRLVQQFLNQLNIRSEGVVLADGSGLSRQNQFTAQAMTDLLTKMLARFDIGPDFLATLRVFGAQGVNTHRLSDSPARAKVRAKTGTLYKVSNLAGYVPSEQGQLYAYAIMLNNNSCGNQGADNVEDQVVEAIYRYGAPVAVSSSQFTPAPAVATQAPIQSPQENYQTVALHQHK